MISSSTSAPVCVDQWKHCSGEVPVRWAICCTTNPSHRLTRSMRSALDTLNLDRLDVVHAGTARYRLAPRVRALPLGELAHVLEPVGSSME